MRYVLLLPLIAVAWAAQAVPGRTAAAVPQQSAAPQRKVPCKTPGNAAMCYWTRGRLRVWISNGTWRLWKVGTKRIVTVFNGPAKFPPHDQEEVSNPEFPDNLERAYRAEVPRPERLNQFLQDTVYADFEICPLEAEKPGESQAVCIESAANIFFDGSKRLYH